MSSTLLAGMPARAQGLTAAQRDAAVNALMARHAGNVPGASLLVLKSGKAVIRRAFGQAILARHVKAAPATHDRETSST